MTTIINANTSAGLTQTADTSGIVKLQSNGVTTNALAWVNFNGTGTVAIRSSYNVSSITDNGTGDYTVNFTAALADANYALCGNSLGGATTSGSGCRALNPLTLTTTSARVIQTAATGTAEDSSLVTVAIFGN